MIFILFRTFISALRSHRALALENLALRHQLEVLKRNTKRPRLTNRDRTLWSYCPEYGPTGDIRWPSSSPRPSSGGTEEGFARTGHGRADRNGWEGGAFPTRFVISSEECHETIRRGERRGFTANCLNSALRSARPRSRSTWFVTGNRLPRVGERS